MPYGFCWVREPLDSCWRWCCGELLAPFRLAIASILGVSFSRKTTFRSGLRIKMAARKVIDTALIALDWVALGTLAADWFNSDR